MADAESRRRIMSGLLSPGLPDRWLSLYGRFSEVQRASLYTPALREAIAARPGSVEARLARLEPPPSPERVFDHLVDDLIAHQLPAGSLARVERIAAARGVEVRHPFLDPSVVDAIVPLPRGYKLGGGSPGDARVLRAVASSILPRTLAIRPRADSTIPPTVFRRSWRVLLAGLLQPRRIDERGLFSARAVRDLVLLTPGSPIVAEEQLYTLATVELFLERFGVSLG